MSQADPTVNNVQPLFHPVSHYDSPSDVLEDASLSTDEKRVILSSWASDMYVVESKPTLREIPGIPHRLRLEDILAALKQSDDDTDPPPRRGLAMRLPRFSKVECTASEAPQRVIDRHAATRRYRSMEASAMRNHLRWTREANVLRYRQLLSTQLTELERKFVERRLAEELHRNSMPLTTMEGIDVCHL
jgi:hypothetical protein